MNARRTNDGATPLYTAAYNGHTEVLKLLLDSSADVNARCFNGDSLIDAAQRYCHVDIIELCW